MKTLPDHGRADAPRQPAPRSAPGTLQDGAGRNLDRPVDDAYRAYWAEVLRQPEPSPEMRDAAALLFRSSRDWYALPAHLAAAVAQPAPVHRVPHRGGALLGIVNVHGRLVPAVSLAHLLKIDDAPAPPTQGRHVFARLLIVAARGRQFALPVAEVDGMVRYASADLHQAAAHAGSGLLRGSIILPGRDAALLDTASLVEALHGALR